MRNIVVAILAIASSGLAADTATARTFPIKFVNETGLVAACNKAGGQSWGGGNHYGCTKTCAPGKLCGVECENGKCKGSTPDRIRGAQDLGGILTSLGFITAPAKPPRTDGILGSGILDNGAGVGSQGPAGTGSPVSAPAAPSAPPVIIR